MPKNERYVVGLDIGTHKIACVVAEMKEGGRVDVVGLGSSLSRGGWRGRGRHGTDFRVEPEDLFAPLIAVLPEFGQQLEQHRRFHGEPLRYVEAGALAHHVLSLVRRRRTRDLPEVVRRADIVVAAAGRPEMVAGDWLKPGATVIDVGINRIDAGEGKTKLVGDVDFAGTSRVAAAITPVPGGVGPMTIAVLLRNCLVAAHQRAGLPAPVGL